MYGYYALLRQRYRLPVLPLAVVLQPGGGVTVSEYEESLFGLTTLRFQYHRIALPDVRAADLSFGNPVVPALLPWLSDRPSDPIDLRLSGYRGIAGSGGDEKRQYVLTAFLEAYSPLGPEQVAELRRRVDNDPEGSAMPLPVPDVFKWGRAEGLAEGRAAGQAEGRAEGEVLGLREAVLRVALRRLGECPPDVETAVRAITALADLQVLLDRALAAETLDELRAALP